MQYLVVFNQQLRILSQLCRCLTRNFNHGNYFCKTKNDLSLLLLLFFYRNHSPWVPIFDQDQESLEWVAMRRTTTREFLRHLQVEKKITMDSIQYQVLWRILIELAGHWETNCEPNIRMWKAVSTPILNVGVAPWLCFLAIEVRPSARFFII